MRRPITYIDVKLVRPLGLDNSAAAAAAQTEFKCKISKKSPRILQSKFPKFVPQFLAY